MDTYPGYVTAWRGFSIAMHTGRLRSTGVQQHTWTPGPREQATCYSGYRDRYEERWHESPAESCRCGIYGVDRLEQLPVAMGYAQWSTTVYALAKVGLYGRVVVGTQGYRAQYAEIHELWVAQHLLLNDELLRTKLELNYRCIVHPWHNVDWQHVRLEVQRAREVNYRVWTLEKKRKLSSTTLTFSQRRALQNDPLRLP